MRERNEEEREGEWEERQCTHLPGREHGHHVGLKVLQFLQLCQIHVRMRLACAQADAEIDRCKDAYVCKCEFICLCAFAYVCVRMHACIHTHIPTMCVCMHECKDTQMCSYIRTHTQNTHFRHRLRISPPRALPLTHSFSTYACSLSCSPWLRAGTLRWRPRRLLRDYPACLD